MLTLAREAPLEVSTEPSAVVAPRRQAPAQEAKAGVIGNEPVGARPGRDRYVDFLRAASLLVVVGWHWVFSIVT